MWNQSIAQRIYTSTDTNLDWLMFVAYAFTHNTFIRSNGNRIEPIAASHSRARVCISVWRRKNSIFASYLSYIIRYVYDGYSFFFFGFVCFVIDVLCELTAESERRRRIKKKYITELVQFNLSHLSMMCGNKIVSMVRSLSLVYCNRVDVFRFVLCFFLLSFGEREKWLVLGFVFIELQPLAESI